MADTHGAVPDRRPGGNRIARRKPAPEWIRRVDMFEASIAPDIANLSLELVLRPARGPRGKPMWYFGRETGNGAVYVFSTKCREEHRPIAELMLKRFKQCHLEILSGKIFPGSLTFATVLREHLANLPRRNSGQQATAQRKKAMATTLLRFFGETELGQYTRGMSLGFIEFFLKENGGRDGGENGRADGKTDGRRDGEEDDTDGGDGPRRYLAFLREAANDYCRRNGVDWWPDRIFVPKRTEDGKRDRWLRKHELARLLLACLGYRWDTANGRWQTREIVEKDGSVRTTRRVITHTRTLLTRRFLSRLIRWAIRTGARHDVYLCMVWGREAKLSSIEFRSDGDIWFHRRGYDESDGPKQRPSTPATRQMKMLARIWAKQDGYDPSAGPGAQHHRYVIRRHDGSYYPGYATLEWRQLCIDAGLGDDVVVHTLKHTAVSWCHAKGYSIADTAAMLGTTEDVLREYYLHWGDELLLRARDAFDDPSRLAAFRTVNHTEPRPDDRVPRGRRKFRPRAPR